MTEAVIAQRKSRAQRYIVLFLWTCLGFAYVALISQWVTVSRRDKQFTEYMSSVIRSSAAGQRSAKEIRALLLIKAEDLSLPVHGDKIQISGSGETLKATVQYTADISMPIVNQPVYRMKFDHSLTSKRSE
jgi:hypothetical protein